jgi:hypothetical protein
MVMQSRISGHLFGKAAIVASCAEARCCNFVTPSSNNLQSARTSAIHSDVDFVPAALIRAMPEKATVKQSLHEAFLT